MMRRMCRTRRFNHACFASLASVLALVAAAQSADNKPPLRSGVILGVLEDLPAEYGEPDQQAVRAIFRKTGEEWLAFPTQTQSSLDLQTLPAFYPKRVVWTIAFNGSSLGTVTAETPAVFRSYALIGVQDITSDNPVPTVGEKSEAFSGFRFAPVYRPLVTLSQPNFANPDAWKPAPPTAAQVISARRLFRSRFPEAANCAGAGGKPHPWMYADGDIQIASAYASARQAALIELRLSGWACNEVPDIGGPFAGQWYALLPSGAVTFLGSDMWLVDTGDYGNDGSSEVLFAITGYNMGGYRLFYRNFTRSAEFVYYFH